MNGIGESVKSLLLCLSLVFTASFNPYIASAATPNISDIPTSIYTILASARTSTPSASQTVINPIRVNNLSHLHPSDIPFGIPDASSSIVVPITPIAPSVSANNITIVNDSSKKVNIANLLRVSVAYRKLVIQKWKTADLPLTIYLVDDWLPATKATGISSQAIGYHWNTGALPHIYVNMNKLEDSVTIGKTVIIFDSYDLSTVVTHEVAEATVNPFASSSRLIVHNKKKIEIEVCDPTFSTFMMDKLPVADFALPSFFKDKGKAPYSYARSLTAPFTTANEGFLAMDS